MGNKMENFFKKQDNAALESLRVKFFDTFSKLFHSKMRDSGSFALTKTGQAGYKEEAIPVIDHYV